MTAVLMGLLLACGPGPETVALQLSSDNPAVREDTARRARNFDSPEVIAGLIKALDDPSEKVRLLAIESLILLDGTDAVPRLMEMIQADDSAEVRKEAIDALGRLKDARAVPALVAYLEANEAGQPALNAIWALGQLGDMSALPVLSRLRENRDPYVAYNANQALRRLRPEGS